MLKKPYMCKMADEKLCRPDNSRRGLGVKVQDVTSFPEDIVLIDRELPACLFITTRQKKLRKSGEALFKFRNGLELSLLSSQILEHLFCSICGSSRIITENFKCNALKGQRRFFRGELGVF